MNHPIQPRTRSFSVLFVDDDPSMQQLARHFVGKTGDIHLDEASSGREALEKFERGGYDAVVSDYDMPGMNGLELLIRIRERDRDFPFIILTGKSRDEIVVPVINHGVSFYIQKGIDNESQFFELWHVIREAIDHHRARIQLEESETRFRLLAERSRDMIYRMRIPEGTYEYVSPSSVEITGFTPQEFYDHPRLVFERIHPECREFLSKSWDALLQGDMPPAYEFMFFHKSGEIRWCRQRNTLIRDERGSPIAIEGSVSDVTAENLAKAELARNEMMYRSMAESAQDIIFILDRDGVVRYVNAYGAGLWGVNSADLVGKSIRVVFPPGTNEHLIESLNEVVRTCAPVKKTRKIPFKEKSLWIESILVPILRDGAIDGIMGMSRDITERKAVELELVEKEETYRALFDASFDAILIASPKGDVLDCNDAACRMFRCQRKDLLDLTWSDLIKGLSAGEGPRIGAGEARGEGTAVRMESIARDGSVFAIELSTRVITVEGTPRVLLLIHRQNPGEN